MVVKLPNASLPTHLDLPETDGLPMDNDFQPTQTELLTSAIRPLLRGWLNRSERLSHAKPISNDWPISWRNGSCRSWSASRC